METYANALKIGILFFSVLIIVELIISRLMNKKVYSLMDTISGLSSGMTNNIKSIFKLTIVIISYDFLVEYLAIFELKVNWIVYLLTFILIDFASYWSHRWNHEINIFWNRHIIHHSSEEFNLSAALRQSISGLFEIYFFLYIPIAILGIPLQVIAILAPIHLFAQFWYHTRLIDRMGFLENIIVTPSHHRVHHAINPEYIDKNYAAIFIVWDKLFGTFQEEKEAIPPVYGVKKPVQTWNPVIINFMHLWQLIKDAWRTENIWDKIRIWFMPTGWRPADVNEKYPIIYNENPYEQVKYKTNSTPLFNIWSILQLVIHLGFQFHILALLPHFPYQTTLVYGIFTVVSIFAYTTLMDRHQLAIPSELFKLLFGLSLLYYYQSWFNENLIVTILVFCYLLFSFGMTYWFSKKDVI